MPSQGRTASARLSVKTKWKKCQDHLIDEQDNRNTIAKTDRAVSLLKTFVQRKVELRNVE